LDLEKQMLVQGMVETFDFVRYVEVKW
jgi:hypothetical protein